MVTAEQNLEDALRLAKDELDSAIKDGEALSVEYWKGYREALKEVQRMYQVSWYGD